MNVTIKSLKSDAKILNNVQKFLFDQIQQEFGYGYVPEWHQDIIKLEDYYINPERNNFFIAYDENNHIIATIGLRAYDKDFEMFKGKYSKDTTASIWRLFVNRRYRRCGLASKMFSVAENFANSKNYKDIYLHTHKTLPGAIQYWTKMGFVVVLDANDELETVHMDKQIRGIEINIKPSIFNYAVEF